MDFFVERRADRLLSSDITGALATLKAARGLSLGEQRSGSPPTRLRGFSRLSVSCQKPFRLGGIQGDRRKGYRLSAVDDAFTRYLPPLQP